ncbi:MAG: Lrp/AsnC family transcriptional regulator [Kangiellaceae bacterium]|nr:Lrp/AsnC family transcriptional regulator [Kangiellaceae bacterium]
MATESEERLLSVLKEDVRATVTDIARKLNVSRATVQARIAKLEKEGVIVGYTLELGKEYLNQYVSAHVAIAAEQKSASIVSSGLMKIEQVSAVHAISGEYDMIAVIHARNTEQLSRLIDFIGELEGVMRTNTSVILETRDKRSLI